MKKIIILALAACLVCPLLTACGENQTPASSVSASAPSTSTAADDYAKRMSAIKEYLETGGGKISPAKKYVLEEIDTKELEGKVAFNFKTDESVILSFTFNTETEKLAFGNISVGEQSEQYPILLLRMLHLSEFGFTDADITEIANAYADSTLPMEANGYYINCAHSPSEIFQIVENPS